MTIIKFGIISGAGPDAGAALYKRIIKLCQKNNLWKDKDFPDITLINFPFSEMLESPFDSQVIKDELEECFIRLKACDHIVIACNTLHLYLPDNSTNLINLIDLTKQTLKQDSNPLFIASRTSAKEQLHHQLLNRNCEYYDVERSQKIIDEILAGKKPDLDWILELAQERKVILGCTEYSFHDQLNKPEKHVYEKLTLKEQAAFDNIIDPLELAAQRMLDLYFLSRTK